MLSSCYSPAHTQANSAMKAISCKISGQGRKILQMLHPTPQVYCFCLNFGPPSAEKNYIPQRRTYWPHFSTVQCPSVLAASCFSTVPAARHPALESGRKPLTGGTRETLPTVCIALKNQHQVMSGITRVLGSLQTMNNQLEWISQCCLRMDTDCCNETKFTCSRAQCLLRLSQEKC